MEYAMPVTVDENAGLMVALLPTSAEAQTWLFDLKSRTWTQRASLGVPARQLPPFSGLRLLYDPVASRPVAIARSGAVWT
jgi:hypothetical protein